MTVDRYTRAVLTVVAGCLVWLCIMGMPERLSAQRDQTAREAGPWSDRAQPVVIVGTGTLNAQGKVTINMVRNGSDAHTDPTVPVTLPYSALNPLPSQLLYTPASPLPVEITAVKKTGEWEPLRAAVEDAPTRAKPGNGRQSIKP
jgi:hypothetical protein